MAHYAFLDENSVVTEVITGVDEDELIEGMTPEEWYGRLRGQTCVRTSYNRSIRKNYAGIGYTYDPHLDAFVAPQPFPSWSLDDDCQWQPPVPAPVDVWCRWDEATLSWVPFA